MRSIVLIVEDDLVSCELFRELFRRDNKIPFKIVHNGEQAIEICKKEKDIRLVLMDYKLPGIDGVETLREIKKISNNIPVVVQTACVYEGDRQDFSNFGFDDYLCKPIVYEELFKIISKFSVECLN
ncbi:MAG: response regulator [Bacteroidales bacterium]|nr:response regulator [Bacteroidales bacterium]